MDPYVSDALPNSFQPLCKLWFIDHDLGVLLLPIG